MRQYFLLALLTICWQNVEGYKILCVLPLPTRSHGYLAKGIIDPLLEAGHQVTWVTSFGDWKTSPNLTLVVVPEPLDLIKKIAVKDHTNIQETKKMAQNINRIVVTNEKVQKLMKEEQFDAVVTEWFMEEHDAGYAAVLQVPWIQLGGMALHFFIENQVDEIRSVPILPFLMSEYTVPMNFWERITTTYITAHLLLNMLWERPAAAATYELHFGPLAKARGIELPPFNEIMHNISIQFVNSHPSISPAIAVPPNVIDIGGYHIEEKIAPLPKDLKDILDSSPQGVVYFSMGSVFKVDDMPKSTAQEFAKMFGELKQTVLWKYDAPLENLPPNVHLRPWFPQASILAHKNTVLFITHGGQLSFLEAVKRGVPLLALPVFGDQPANAARAVNLGFARHLPWSPDVVPELREELKIMLSNRNYYERARELSYLFNSRPVKPKDLVTHYIELAIETKGAGHLRAASRHYPWWARYMIDQLLVVIVLLAAIVKALKFIVNKLFFKKTKAEKTKSKRS